MTQSLFASSLRTATAMALMTSSVLAGVAPAAANDLQTNISCVNGFVDSYDFAELEQNFAETTFDTRSRLILRSDTAALTLEVSDINGNSVCEEVAELRTSCTWNLTAGGIYKVKIDNSNRSTESKYRLCAG